MLFLEPSKMKLILGDQNMSSRFFRISMYIPGYCFRFVKLLSTSSWIEKTTVYKLNIIFLKKCTWDNDGISRCVMLWISPAGCCARVTIDWNIIFWIWINWNDGDWLNVFSEDKFFNLNVKCNQLLSADINLQNTMCRKWCE